MESSRNLQCTWSYRIYFLVLISGAQCRHPEYTSYMIEGTPSDAYGGLTEDLLKIEVAHRCVDALIRACRRIWQCVDHAYWLHSFLMKCHNSA